MLLRLFLVNQHWANDIRKWCKHNCTGGVRVKGYVGTMVGQQTLAANAKPGAKWVSTNAAKLQYADYVDFMSTVDFNLFKQSFPISEKRIRRGRFHIPIGRCR